MKHKNIKLILNYVIGPLVFCILMISIYYQIQDQQENGLSLVLIKNIFSSENWVLMISILILMVINWGIEAKKWQLSISSLTKVSYWTSFKAIFSGTTVAFFTPNRIGEYVGRMWYVKKEYRLHSIPLTILGSLTQLTITILAGMFSFIYWYLNENYHPIETNLLHILLGISLLLSFLLILFFIKTKWLFNKLFKIPWLQKFQTYFIAVLEIDKQILYKLLAWSLARYFVFILQYWLMMEIFGIKLSVIMVMGIMGTIFFLLAIIPTFGELMDMGIRLKAGVYMLHTISGNISGMLATSLTIWIVNLVIPALIGSLLILTIRIFNDRNNELIKPELND